MDFLQLGGTPYGVAVSTDLQLARKGNQHFLFRLLFQSKLLHNLPTMGAWWREINSAAPEL